MKLRDAEQLLKAVKEQGPIMERWSVFTDEGITLEAWPLGFARGSLGLQEALTIIPHQNYFALFEGGSSERPVPLAHPRWSPRKMWQQETWVYLRELREAMSKALEGIDRAPFYPRLGESKSQPVENDPLPRADDFHLLFPPRPAIGWYLEGEQDVTGDELERIKTEFCQLLELSVS